MQILSDFIMCLKARKHGATMKPVRTVPVIDIGYWSWTPEACLTYPDGVRDAVKAIFYSFNGQLQRSLTFAPDDGEWVERVRMWQTALKPVLTQEQYSATILKILDWAIRCKQRRLGLRSSP